MAEEADQKKKQPIGRIVIDAVVGLAVIAIVAGFRMQADMHDSQNEHAMLLKSISEVVSCMKQDQQDATKERNELRIFQTKTEASRFTAKDGQDVWQEIYRIQKEIAVLTQSMNVEIPPPWFKQQVEDLSERVRSIEKERHENSNE